ncbi:hypothetical protein D3C72_1856980 [compost metagenome]
MPPMTPKLMTGAPSRIRKPGMMVWKGRLPPATTLGWSGWVLKQCPRFCRLTPVPGTTTPEPKPM